MDVGQRIRCARLANGLTQTELGEMVGVQKSAVSKWERGETQNIKRSVLKSLAEILGLEPYELIAGDSFEPVVSSRATVTESREEASAEHDIIMTMYGELSDANKWKLAQYLAKLLDEQHQEQMRRLMDNYSNMLKGGD